MLITKKSLLKTASLVTLLIFLGQQLTPPPLAQAAEIRPQTAIQIPENIGRLEVNAPAENSKIIFHIQDAHGNEDAQKNIREILSHLTSRYDQKIILLEGGHGKLHPELLNFFPNNPALNLQIADSLVKKAELSGAERFLLAMSFRRSVATEKSHIVKGKISRRDFVPPRNDIISYGLENIAAYRGNREAFQKVLRAREKTSAFLSEMDDQINRLSAPRLNPFLKNFLKKSEDHQAGLTDFLTWQLFLKEQTKKYLEIDLDDPFYQREWPMMVRLFRLHANQAKIRHNKIEAEKIDFLKALRSLQIQVSLLEKIEKVLQSLAMNKTTFSFPYQETLNAFGELLEALPADFSFKPYENLRLTVQSQILQSELKSDALADEIEKLETLIQEKLAKDETERKILTLYKSYSLLKKLFRLELTLKDHHVILSGAKGLRPSFLIQEFLTLNQDHRVKKVSFSHLAEIDQLHDLALSFYDGARKRDGLMADNALKVMRHFKKESAVLVTGGFHSQGMKEYFESKGFTYYLITPQISELGDSKAYLNAMLAGNTSVILRPRAEKSQIALMLKLQHRAKILAEAGPAYSEHLSNLIRSELRTVDKTGINTSLLQRQYNLDLSEPFFPSRSEMRVNPDDFPSLPDWLNALVQAGTSRAQIAQAAEISKSVVEFWIYGERAPKFSQLQKIGTHLGFDLQALLKLRYRSQISQITEKTPLADLLTQSTIAMDKDLKTAAEQALKIFEASLAEKTRSRDQLSANKISKEMTALNIKDNIVTVFHSSLFREFTSRIRPGRELTHKEPFDFFAIVNRAKPEEYAIFLTAAEQPTIALGPKNQMVVFEKTNYINLEQFQTKAPFLLDFAWRARGDFFKDISLRNEFLREYASEANPLRDHQHLIKNRNLIWPNLDRGGMWESIRNRIYLLRLKRNADEPVIIFETTGTNEEVTPFQFQDGRYNALFIVPQKDNILFFSSLQEDPSRTPEEDPERHRPLLSIQGSGENFSMHDSPELYTFFLSTLSRFSNWNLGPLYFSQTDEHTAKYETKIIGANRNLTTLYFGNEFRGALARLTVMGSPDKNSGVPAFRLYRAQSGQLDDQSRWVARNGQIVAEGQISLTPDGRLLAEGSPLDIEPLELITEITSLEEGLAFSAISETSSIPVIQGNRFYPQLFSDLLAQAEQPGSVHLNLSQPFLNMGHAKPIHIFGTERPDIRDPLSTTTHNIFPRSEVQPLFFDHHRQLWIPRQALTRIELGQQDFQSTEPQLIFHAPQPLPLNTEIDLESPHRILRSEMRTSELTPTESHQKLADYLAKEYGWGNILKTRMISGGGGIHSEPLLAVKNSMGEHIIKRIKVKDKESAIFVSDYVRHLQMHGIPIPAETKANGEMLTEFEGKFYVVERFLNGREFSRKDASPEALRAAGRLLGKIHNASKDFKWNAAKEYNHFSLQKAIDLELNLEAKWRQMLKRYFTEDESRLVEETIQQEAFFTKQALASLEMRAIASDFNFGNIIFNHEGNEIIGVFDWDQARIAYPAEDFFPILFHTGRRGEFIHLGNLKEDLSALLKGYQEVASLNETEQSLIPRMFPIQFINHLVIGLENLSNLNEPDRQDKLNYFRRLIQVLRALKAELPRSETRTEALGESRLVFQSPLASSIDLAQLEKPETILSEEIRYQDFINSQERLKRLLPPGSFSYAKPALEEFILNALTASKSETVSNPSLIARVEFYPAAETFKLTLEQKIMPESGWAALVQKQQELSRPGGLEALIQAHEDERAKGLLYFSKGNGFYHLAQLMLKAPVVLIYSRSPERSSGRSEIVFQPPPAPETAHDGLRSEMREEKVEFGAPFLTQQEQTSLESTEPLFSGQLDLAVYSAEYIEGKGWLGLDKIESFMRLPYEARLIVQELVLNALKSLSDSDEKIDVELKVSSSIVHLKIRQESGAEAKNWRRLKLNAESVRKQGLSYLKNLEKRRADDALEVGGRGFSTFAHLAEATDTFLTYEKAQASEAMTTTLFFRLLAPEGLRSEMREEKTPQEYLIQLVNIVASDALAQINGTTITTEEIAQRMARRVQSAVRALPFLTGQRIALSLGEALRNDPVLYQKAAILYFESSDFKKLLEERSKIKSQTILSTYQDWGLSQQEAERLILLSRSEMRAKKMTVKDLEKISSAFPEVGLSLSRDGMQLTIRGTKAEVEKAGAHIRSHFPDYQGSPIYKVEEGVYSKSFAFRKSWLGRLIDGVRPTRLFWISLFISFALVTAPIIISFFSTPPPPAPIVAVSKEKQTEAKIAEEFKNTLRSIQEKRIEVSLADVLRAAGNISGGGKFVRVTQEGKIETTPQAGLSFARHEQFRDKSPYFSLLDNLTYRELQNFHKTDTLVNRTKRPDPIQTWGGPEALLQLLANPEQVTWKQAEELYYDSFLISLHSNLKVIEKVEKESKFVHGKPNPEPLLQSRKEWIQIIKDLKRGVHMGTREFPAGHIDFYYPGWTLHMPKSEKDLSKETHDFLHSLIAELEKENPALDPSQEAGRNEIKARIDRHLRERSLAPRSEMRTEKITASIPGMEPLDFDSANDLVEFIRQKAKELRYKDLAITTIGDQIMGQYRDASGSLQSIYAINVRNVESLQPLINRIFFREAEAEKQRAELEKIQAEINKLPEMAKQVYQAPNASPNTIGAAIQIVRHLLREKKLITPETMEEISSWVNELAKEDPKVDVYQTEGIIGGLLGTFKNETPEKTAKIYQDILDILQLSGPGIKFHLISAWGYALANYLDALTNRSPNDQAVLLEQETLLAFAQAIDPKLEEVFERLIVRGGVGPNLFDRLPRWGKILFMFAGLALSPLFLIHKLWELYRDRNKSPQEKMDSNEIFKRAVNRFLIPAGVALFWSKDEHGLYYPVFFKNNSAEQFYSLQAGGKDGWAILGRQLIPKWGPDSPLPPIGSHGVGHDVILADLNRMEAEARSIAMWLRPDFNLFLPATPEAVKKKTIADAAHFIQNAYSVSLGNKITSSDADAVKKIDKTLLNLREKAYRHLAPAKNDWELVTRIMKADLTFVFNHEVYHLFSHSFELREKYGLKNEEMLARLYELAVENKTHPASIYQTLSRLILEAVNANEDLKLHYNYEDIDQLASQILDIVMPETNAPSIAGEKDLSKRAKILADKLTRFNPEEMSPQEINRLVREHLQKVFGAEFLDRLKEIEKFETRQPLILLAQAEKGKPPYAVQPKLPASFHDQDGLRSEMREVTSEIIQLGKIDRNNPDSAAQVVGQFIEDIANEVEKMNQQALGIIRNTDDRGSATQLGPDVPTVYTPFSTNTDYLRKFLTRLFDTNLDGTLNPEEAFHFAQAFGNRKLRLVWTNDDNENRLASLKITSSPNEMIHNLRFRSSTVREFYKINRPALASLFLVLGFRHYILGKISFNENMENRRLGNFQFAEAILRELGLQGDSHNELTVVLDFLETLQAENTNLPRNFLHDLYDNLKGMVDGDPRLAGIELEFAHAIEDIRITPRKHTGKTTVTAVKPKPGAIHPGLRFGPMLSSGSGELRFEMKESLGQGSFGEVWKAYDHDLHIYVAIKVTGPNAHGTHAATRVLREWHGLREVSSKYTPFVYYIGWPTEDDPSSYIVMTLAHGETLAALMESPKFYGEDYTVARTALLLKTAEALFDLTARGLVHRDLKPGNIMVQRTPKSSELGGIEHFKLIDFGLASLMKDQHEPAVDDFNAAAFEAVFSDTVTQFGAFLGTPTHIAPERTNLLDHEISDVRRPSVDVFALGVILYSMLTGNRIPGNPESRSNQSILKIVENHALGRFKEPIYWNPTMDPKLNALTMKLLSPAFKGMSVTYFRSLLRANAHFRKLNKNGEAVSANLRRLKNAPDAVLEKFIRNATDQKILLRPGSEIENREELLHLLHAYFDPKLKKNHALAKAWGNPAAGRFRRSEVRIIKVSKQLLDGIIPIIATGAVFLAVFTALFGNQMEAHAAEPKPLVIERPELQNLFAGDNSFAVIGIPVPAGIQKSDLRQMILELKPLLDRHSKKLMMLAYEGDFSEKEAAGLYQLSGRKVVLFHGNEEVFAQFYAGKLKRENIAAGNLVLSRARELTQGRASVVSIAPRSVMISGAAAFDQSLSLVGKQFENTPLRLSPRERFMADAIYSYRAASLPAEKLKQDLNELRIISLTDIVRFSFDSNLISRIQSMVQAAIQILKAA